MNMARLWIVVVISVAAACGESSGSLPSRFVGSWTADMGSTEAASSRSPAADRSAAFAGVLAVASGALTDGTGVEIKLLANGNVEISGPFAEIPTGSWNVQGDDLILDPDGTGKMTERYRLLDGKLVGAGGITLVRR